MMNDLSRQPMIDPFLNFILLDDFLPV